MKKRLRLFTSLMALSCSQILWSLGLGDITVESALNEPLVAKIELLNVAGLSNGEMIVGIGSVDDYRITDIKREFFHTNLAFEARIDGQSVPYISVTSSQPVTEPFLNIVVQARWPQGKLLGVYTLLLDLPVYSGRAQTEAVAAPQRVAESAPQPAPRAAPPRATTAPAVRPAVPRITTDIGDQYRVQTGDTLWRLAGAVAANTGSTRHQAMLAIRDVNPEAFINGDPNALKAGTLLRMPDQQESRRRSASDAAAEFASLQQRSGRALAATPISSSSTNFRDQSSAASAAGGRLALSSNAALGAGAGNGASGAVDDQFIGTIVDENQALKEELDKARIENAELAERLAAREEQLSVATALIELEDNELADIQDGLQTAIAESASEDMAVEEQLAAEDTASAPAAVAAPAPAPVAAAITSSPSLLDRLMGFLPYIGAVILVLLLVVALLMKRRKANDDDLLSDDLESELEDHEDHDEFASEEAAADAMPEQAASFVVEDENVDDGLESMDELFADDDEEQFDIAADSAAEDEDLDQEPDSSDISDIDADAPDMDGIGDEDVQDIDLEGALEDLDEFADLDSFFDDSDVEDFDPDADADDLEEIYEENAEHKDDHPEEQGDFSETMIASADALSTASNPAGADKASEQDSELDFESLQLPEEDAMDDTDLTDLDDEQSLDFDEGIELPAEDQDAMEEAVEADSENSLEFDLGDFDTMSDTGADAADEEDSTPAGNEMDFDAEGIELPSVDETETAEDVHDEEHLMDFDEDVVVPVVAEDDQDLEQDDENTMAFDIEDDTDTVAAVDSAGDSDADDLSSALEEEDMDELLSGMDDDFDLGDDLLAEFGDDGDVTGEDLSEEINTKIELADAYIDMGDVRGAKELIDEILADGDDNQKQAAQKLADSIVGLV